MHDRRSFFLLRTLLLLLLSSPVAGTAQSTENIFSTVLGGLAQAAMVQSAWNNLPQSELRCIGRMLQPRGSSIVDLIQNGVAPTDQSISNLRAACAGPKVPVAFSGKNYVVDGLALGGQVQFGSEAYRSYDCAESEQFPGLTSCHKKQEMLTRRGSSVLHYSAYNSILHSQDGIALYINRYLQPAWFSGHEATDDIDRLSKKFGQPSRIIPIPKQPDSSGMIVTWGDVSLEQLDPANTSELAAGHDVRAGFMIDHIGNFQKSAQHNLPIYRITGKAGYIWAASWNDAGVGTLRFLAIDASAIAQLSTASLPTAPVASVIADKPSATEPHPAISSSVAPATADAASLVDESKGHLTAEPNTAQEVHDPEAAKLRTQFSENNKDITEESRNQTSAEKQAAEQARDDALKEKQAAEQARDEALNEKQGAILDRQSSQANFRLLLITTGIILLAFLIAIGRLFTNKRARTRDNSSSGYVPRFDRALSDSLDIHNRENTTSHAVQPLRDNTLRVEKNAGFSYEQTPQAQRPLPSSQFQRLIDVLKPAQKAFSTVAGTVGLIFVVGYLCFVLRPQLFASSNFDSAPNFRVQMNYMSPVGAMTQSGIQNGFRYLHIQSAEDRDLVVRKVLIDNKEPPSNILSLPKMPLTMKLGDEIGTMVGGPLRTLPVKVEIVTDRGSSVYTFD